MLRSVILLAGIILILVVLIAPSLPTPMNEGASAQGDALTGQQDDLPQPASPDSVDRLFQSDNQGAIASPDLVPRPTDRRDRLVDLPPIGSAEAQAGLADEY